MLALNIAEGPIVATFHTSTTKSLTLSVFEPILRPMHEKIVGRIAVSDLARRWQMEALGSDAVEIPNGVDVASFATRRCSTATRGPESRCCSLAASTSPARAWPCCSAHCRRWWSVPDIEILIVGRGDEDELREDAGKLAGHLRFLGQVDDAEKASAMRSADVYCAPTSAGRASASCLSRRWRRAPRWWPATSMRSAGFSTTARPGGWCRSTTPRGWRPGWSRCWRTTSCAARYVEAATEAVRRYDWSVVARQIMRVYETVAGAGVKVQVAS